MKTTTNTEFAVMGVNSDGTSRTLSKRFGDVPSAQQYVGEYISYTERFPNDFKPFDEYKLVKRAIVKTVHDWREV
jgi:hypothetical protein